MLEAPPDERPRPDLYGWLPSPPFHPPAPHDEALLAFTIRDALVTAPVVYGIPGRGPLPGAARLRRKPLELRGDVVAKARRRMARARRIRRDPSPWDSFLAGDVDRCGALLREMVPRVGAMPETVLRPILAATVPVRGGGTRPGYQDTATLARAITCEVLRCEGRPVPCDRSMRRRLSRVITKP